MGVKNEVLFKILDRLQKIYQIPKDINRKVPIIEQMIHFVLKSGENPENVQRAYVELQQDYADWNEVRVTHPRDIYQTLAKHLKCNVQDKAMQLKEVLTHIFNKYNKLDLEFLWEKEFSEQQKVVCQIPCLGMEFVYLLTAAALYDNENNLCNAFVKVGKRLNLWDDTTSSGSLKKTLAKELKDLGVEGLAKLNILFYIHSETICGTKADCLHCQLLTECEYGQRQAKSVTVPEEPSQDQPSSEKPNTPVILPALEENASPTIIPKVVSGKAVEQKITPEDPKKAVEKAVVEKITERSFVEKNVLEEAVIQKNVVEKITEKSDVTNAIISIEKTVIEKTVINLSESALSPVAPKVDSPTTANATAANHVQEFKKADISESKTHITVDTKDTKNKKTKKSSIDTPKDKKKTESSTTKSKNVPKAKKKSKTQETSKPKGTKGKTTKNANEKITKTTNSKTITKKKTVPKTTKKAKKTSNKAEKSKATGTKTAKKK